MGIVMPGAAHGRAAALAEDAGGVVSLDRIAKSKAERGKKRLDSAAEEACAWLAYAPRIGRLAEAPLVAESFAMWAAPPSGVTSTPDSDACPEAETSVDRSNVDSQTPTPQLNAAAAPGSADIGALSPAVPGMTARAAVSAEGESAVAGAAIMPRPPKPAPAAPRWRMQEPRGIAGAQPSSHAATVETLGVSLSPGLPTDPPAHPRIADKTARTDAAWSNPVPTDASETGVLPHRSEPPLPRWRPAPPSPAETAIPVNHRAPGVALDPHAASLPSRRPVAASAADWQRSDDKIARAESLAGFPGGMDRPPDLKHIARAGLQQGRREVEAAAPQTPAPASSPSHGAETELAPVMALAVKAGRHVEARLPDAPPADHAVSAAAATREPAVGDVSPALNLPAPLIGETGVLQGGALQLSGEPAAQNPRMLRREASFIQETRGADGLKAAHSPSRKSARAYEWESGGAETGAWGARASLSRGGKPDAPHPPASKKVAEQNRHAAAEADKSPSGMNFRFQSWGETHAVTITAETGPSGWQLQLQPSDGLVSQRLSEQWASGNPQQWRLLPGDGEGRRDAPPRQSETEEDE